MSTTLHTPTLDHAGIASRIPHQGAMCLLDRMSVWSDDRIVCTARNHRDAHHPLRTASGLMTTAGIEYAAQAAALHGALLAEASGFAASPGFLASARDVRSTRWRLDDLARADIDELVIVATRQAGDASRLLYAFTVSHAGEVVVSGRLAVVLNAMAATA